MVEDTRIQSQADLQSKLLTVRTPIANWMLQGGESVRRWVKMKKQSEDNLIVIGEVGSLTNH